MDFNFEMLRDKRIHSHRFYYLTGRKHLNITVAGRVQGVFFRASTKTFADHFNIKGHVKNQPDRSVYIEEQFIDWCKQGPKAAKVDELEVQENA